MVPVHVLINRQPLDSFGTRVWDSLHYRCWRLCTRDKTATDHCVPAAAVEACVLHGLRRRAAGFLRSNKIAALFMKVGKGFPPAEELSRKVQELEQLIESA